MARGRLVMFTRSDRDRGNRVIDINWCYIQPCSAFAASTDRRFRPRGWRSARPGDRRQRRRPARHRRAAVPRLGPSHRPHRPASQGRGLRRARHGLRPLGGAAVADRGRRAARRPARHVLGHLAAHRRRPRPRPARQPGSLPDPRRALRHLQRRLSRDRPPRGQAQPAGDPHRRRLVRAARRRRDARRLGVRADRLSARRRLAPDLRPGRHPLGADAPDADRRRRADPGRQRDPDHRGARRRGLRAVRRPPDRARRPRRRRRCALPARLRDGRAADRPVHLPGRVRLRRPAVPARARADHARLRRGRGAGRGADLDRPRRRARRGDLLHRRARRDRPDRRRRLRPDDAAPARSTSSRRSASRASPWSSRRGAATRSAPRPAC